MKYHQSSFILRYSVVLFGVKHVVAQAFPDGSDTFVCIDYDEANYEEYA